MVANTKSNISSILNSFELKANPSLKDFDFCEFSVEDSLRIMQECEENGENRIIPSEINNFFRSALTISSACRKEDVFTVIDFVSIAIFLCSETGKALKNTSFSYENPSSGNGAEHIIKTIQELRTGSEEDKISAFVMLTVIDSFSKQQYEKEKVTQESVQLGMTKLLLVFCWAYQNNIVTAKEVLIVGKFFDLAYEGEIK